MGSLVGLGGLQAVGVRHPRFDQADQEAMAAAETVPSPRSLAAIRSGVPSFETLSAVPPSRDATF
jgi:hypothetical protein